MKKFLLAAILSSNFFATTQAFAGPYYCSRNFNTIADPSLQTINIECVTNVGLVRYYSEHFATLGAGEYPPELDTATIGTCSTSNPCLDDVLPIALTDGDWAKTSNTTYENSATGSLCSYDATNGKMTCTL